MTLSVRFVPTSALNSSTERQFCFLFLFYSFFSLIVLLVSFLFILRSSTAACSFFVAVISGQSFGWMHFLRRTGDLWTHFIANEHKKEESKRNSFTTFFSLLLIPYYILIEAQPRFELFLQHKLHTIIVLAKFLFLFVKSKKISRRIDALLIKIK